MLVILWPGTPQTVQWAFCSGPTRCLSCGKGKGVVNRQKDTYPPPGPKCSSYKRETDRQQVTSTTQQKIEHPRYTGCTLEDKNNNNL